jgi:hypothetical protein
MKRFLYNNSLSIVVFAIFVFAILGMSLAGWQSNNESLKEHHEPPLAYGSYLVSSEFGEGVFENWESEFLQMGALIVLTIFLRQKGSADSKSLREGSPQDTTSRYSIIRASTWRQRKKATGHFFYRHSLSLAMLALFVLSFSLHALEGASAYNEEAVQHHSPTTSVLGYIVSSQFWYESLQNWQSEFLAIGTLLVLSIKLRQAGSPESKPVGKKYDQTTGE